MPHPNHTEHFDAILSLIETGDSSLSSELAFREQGITDADVERLVAEILREPVSECVQINLENNALTNAAIPHLARLVREHPTLERLYL